MTEVNHDLASKFHRLAKMPLTCLWRGAILLTALSACQPHDNADKKIIIDPSQTVSEETLTNAKQAPRTEAANRTLRFGFDLRNTPQEDARQYLPFLAYLSQATGYHFELKFTPANSSLVNELGANKLDFAAIGATGYIKAREQHQAKILARGVNKLGKAEYQSMIVTNVDSRLRELEQLKGKSLAFGHADSTQGHLIPRILLENRGILLNELANYQYTGSHHNCAQAVMSKRADACGMQDTMAKEMASKGLVKIMHTSDYFPSSGIAAAGTVPGEIRDKVKQALLAFDPQYGHREGLYNWEKTEMPKGFKEASDNDYQKLHDWMVKLQLFQK